MLIALIVTAALAVAVFALSERILREYENGRSRLRGRHLLFRFVDRT